MSDIRRCNIYQQDFLVQTNSDYEPVNEESTQSLQASVRKQQVQFALLTKEIDNERKTCAQQLNNNKFVNGTAEQHSGRQHKYSSNVSNPSMRRFSASTLSSTLENPSSVTDAAPSIEPEEIQVEDYGWDDDRNSFHKKSGYDDEGIDYGLNSTSNKKSSSVSSNDSGTRIGKNWKTPTLEEVISMLSYNMPVVQENAAAFLQHLCYGDDKVKESVRKLGGIYPLIKLLGSDKEKIVWNACGALRNISYGRRNDKNKLKMMQYDAVPALIRIVQSCPDTDFKEQATGTLLNLSAHPEVKGQVVELGLEVLTKHVIAPYAAITSDANRKLDDIVLFDVFVNAVAIIRNLSSADSIEARKRIRKCDRLLHSIISVLRVNSETGDVDNKVTEHSVCILQNLTYKLQVETSNWKLYLSDSSASKDSILPNFFRFKKRAMKDSYFIGFERTQDNPFARNAELLWQPSTARLYVYLLGVCSDYRVIEALLGSIQNLTHGVWKWAAYTRYAVRIKKGLPVILDFLAQDNDDLIRSAAITLSNLAEDSKNKQLIGKYGMDKLIRILPDTAIVDCPLSEMTIVAILHCLRGLVAENLENVKSFCESDGMETVLSIKNGNYHPKMLKACELLFLVMWTDKASKSYLKKQGWNKMHFAFSSR